MKYLIASDLHGSFYYAEKLLQIYKDEKADKLILLGDLLYHGPRNQLPKDYNPMKVFELFNTMTDEIIAVRGNCDSEVDQMVLNFPMMADYAIINDGARTLFATHGHLFNEENLPPLSKGAIFMHGHTHVHEISDRGSYVFLNPGSLSLAKGDEINSYAIYENNIITLKDLNGEVLSSLELQ